MSEIPYKKHDPQKSLVWWYPEKNTFLKDYFAYKAISRNNAISVTNWVLIHNATIIVDTDDFSICGMQFNTPEDMTHFIMRYAYD